MIDVVYLFKQFPELPQAVKEVIVDELLKLTYPDGFNDPRITASVRKYNPILDSESLEYDPVRAQQIKDFGPPPTALFDSGDDTLSNLFNDQ